MVEGLRGHRYDKPLSAMRAYLDGIHKDLPAGEEAPGDGRSARSEDAGAERREIARRRALQRDAQHTAQAAAILGPKKWLAVEQKVTIETDPGRARAIGRKELSRYMVLPNYRNNWLREASPKPSLPMAAATASSMPWSCGAMRRRSRKGLRAHFDAGATHVCLQPVHADGDFAARDRMLAALADT